MQDRIPFFFEPDFDAEIKPLPAAIRILSDGPRRPGKQEPEEAQKKYDPIVYGRFLLSKVTNNFDTGKGRYD